MNSSKVVPIDSILPSVIKPITTDNISTDNILASKTTNSNIICTSPWQTSIIKPDKK
jgi:hypothetical protein